MITKASAILVLGRTSVEQILMQRVFAIRMHLEACTAYRDTIFAYCKGAFVSNRSASLPVKINERRYGFFLEVLIQRHGIVSRIENHLAYANIRQTLLHGKESLSKSVEIMP